MIKIVKFAFRIAGIALSVTVIAAAAGVIAEHQEEKESIAVMTNSDGSYVDTVSSAANSISSLLSSCTKLLPASVGKPFRIILNAAYTAAKNATEIILLFICRS